MQIKFQLWGVVAILFLLNFTTTAQVAINLTSSPPHVSAMLDVDHPSKGLLIPRVALTATNSNLPIGPSIATSLMVYNTFTSNASSPFPVVQGYYYWNGTRWIYLGSDRSWSISGNGGTIAGQNFIGTTDNVDVVFKRNFTQSGLLNSSSNNTSWGVGALSPNSTGTGNTAIGRNAMQNNTAGSSNTALGTIALQNNTTGNLNTAVGNAALLSNTGQNNTSVGASALQTNTTGTNNTGLGDNTLLFNATGSFNTAIGSGAGTNAPGLSNTTALGAGSVTTANDQVRIGDANVLSIGGFQGWSNVSDGRFKRDINETVPGLTFINKLRPVTYQLNMDMVASFLRMPESARMRDAEAKKAAMLQTGFIAQEVEKAAQELGYSFSGIDKPKNANDYYSLRYAEFTAPMVKAIQEQQVMIEKLQSENKLLFAELNEIKKAISAMKSRLPLQVKVVNE